MLSSNAPSKLGVRTLTLSRRASGPSLESMKVAAPIAMNEARKSLSAAKYIASSPSAAPSPVYRCTAQANAVSIRCFGTALMMFRAAPLDVISLARLQVARAEVSFEHRHKGAAGAARLHVRHRLVERHAAMRMQVCDRERRGAVEARVTVQIDPLIAANKGMQIVERGPQPRGHLVRAAVLDGSADELDAVLLVLLP